MKSVGIVGLGDMGIGLSRNILKAGFTLKGFDLREERRQMLSELGGTPVTSIKEVAEGSDIVFVMVLNGAQVKSVVLDEGGLKDSMQPGSCILVSATINPSEVREIVEPVTAKGIDIIDSPVSGGKSGAEGGTLTMMVAAKKAVFDKYNDVLSAVGKDLFHVGEETGQGQTVKAALQALIGSSFTAIFEALVLGTKAGADPRTLYEVFCSSGVGSGLLKGCGELILERKFEKTGSHIGTMYKDLGISMNMAKENGCAMFTASAAYELFRSGMSLYPEGDNWSIIKLLEQIAGTEVKG
ncbi:MAG: NAD(P)-dependent oxidoreductase [Spirochaetales bacterium]|nr:NAD(P)-dependent oxidoreductase [Spirochaetales bacterium]